MDETGFVLDERYTHHDTGRGHPERRERIDVLLESVHESPGLRRVGARMATADEVMRVHDEAHFVAVERTRDASAHSFDADTPASTRSFETACLAAGGLLALVEEVMAGTLRNGFAMVRPPGHHAERARAMGFCLFNNVAVAAAHLRQHYGLERILIMDWDVHHGNGTQHSFYDDSHVLYVSTHRFPFYPGTGAAGEVGHGDGTGFTVNVPMPGGCGDDEYAAVFDTIVEPIAMQYAPEFVLISAGFDPHARDPLGGMGVSESGFARMARSLLQVAAASSGGKCVAVLEGGYDLQAMRASARDVLGELCRHEPAAVGPPVGAAGPLIDAVRRAQRPYWKL